MFRRPREAGIFVLTMSAAVGLPAHAGGAAEDDHKTFEQKDIVGAFVGMTENHYGTYETYGLEYTYKATERLGVGLVVEHLPDGGNGYEANVVVGFATFNLTHNFRTIIGAGKEYHKGHEAGIYRAGFAYDFHIGKHMHLTPTIAVDFLEDDENIVGGLVLARAF